MADRSGTEDRTSGVALMLFVVVQLAYLVAPTGVASAPSLDASIADWRALLREDSVAPALRWDGVIPAINFIVFLVPGSVGLRRRLIRSASRRNVWQDLVVAGVLLVTMTVFIASATYAVLGLVPVDELSDSVLRVTVMANWYAIFGIGSMAVALFLGAASLAILKSERSRWLAWWGIATAATSIAGTAWVVSADFDGPLLGLNVLARASFLAWVMATGLWLVRTTPSSASAPAASGASTPR